jgi:phasin family protein
MIKDFQGADFSSFTASIEKLVALNTAKFEAAVQTQTAAAQDLVELTQSRVKALTEVKDFDGLNAFYQEQNELAQKAVAKAVADSKTAVEEAQSYGEEVKKIVTQSVETATAEVKKAAKKVA